MKDSNWNIHAEYRTYEDNISIYIADSFNNVIRPVILTAEVQEPLEPGLYYSEPSFRLSRQEAQALLDALYQAGLRPHDGSGSLQHIEALKYHLEDMRQLVFKKK